MKVAIDLTALLPQPSGVDTYLLGLVRALADIDEETRYTVYLNQEDRALLELPRNFAVVAASRRPRAVRLAFQQGFLPLASRLADADVVHSPSFIMPLYRGRQGHVVTVHDLTSFTRPECHTRLRRSRAYRAGIAASVRRADRVIVHAEHVRLELGRLFPRYDTQRVHVIPSGVAKTFATSAAVTTPGPLARLGVTAPYLLFVGTLEPRKNLAMLLRAYCTLVREGREEHLVLAGRLGWGDGGLNGTLDAPELQARVHVVGYVDSGELPALYAGARTFVYPSLEEGFGFPPLEAMASGVPTVASSSSSLGENLSGAAELVPPSDPEALADAIRRVLEDDRLRERLRRAGLERAATFTWDRAARRTLACYEQVARARARRRRTSFARAEAQ